MLLVSKSLKLDGCLGSLVPYKLDEHHLIPIPEAPQCMYIMCIYIYIYYLFSIDTSESITIHTKYVCHMHIYIFFFWKTSGDDDPQLPTNFHFAKFGTMCALAPALPDPNLADSMLKRNQPM